MKIQKLAILFMAITISLTMLTSCNDEEENREKLYSKAELIKPIVDNITSQMNTEYFSKDSLDLMLQQYVLDIYLKNNNYLAIGMSKDNPNLIEWTNIPYNTELGNAITKKIEKQKFLKYSSYNNKDYDKVVQWAKSEIDKGQIVIISREKDGSYTALSYSLTEWVLIYGRP